jgi:hypothetical protein
MDLTEGSETSKKNNLTPGKYPKEHIQENCNVFTVWAQYCNKIWCSLKASSGYVTSAMHT